MVKAPFEYNVRLYSYTNQGGRKYMEDAYCVAYQQKKKQTATTADLSDQANKCHDDNGLKDESSGKDTSVLTGTSNEDNQAKKDLEYVYVGIFDGHGGKEAALFTRDYLLQNIISQKEFWSNDDQLILQSIKQGFVATHYQMLNVVATWPRTSSGLPSTAGTTASICFIMNNKYYTGHVGDSRIVLGKKNKETGMWIPYSLTTDHKPDAPEERKRIYDNGGEVMNKSGVERVVWNRPKTGHRGPIRRSTSFDRIPFLAVARSLGDLWSYNPDNDVYIVSPEPDCEVVPINPDEDKCLVLASDGLWNMLVEHECIRLVQEMEEPFECERDLLNSIYNPAGSMGFYEPEPTNPSQTLVSFALQRWFSSRLRADNTSVLTVLLDHRDPVGSEEVEMSLPPKEAESVPLPEISDDELATLVDPVILPHVQYASECLISPDHLPLPAAMKSPFHEDNNTENIPVDRSAGFAFSHCANNRQSAQRFNDSQNNVNVCDDDKYSLLSPAMQSLCELARGDAILHPEGKKDRSSLVVEADSEFTEINKPRNGPSPTNNNLYVNELPEESFQAFLNTLKMKNGSKLHKVINGVKVFRDYQDFEEKASSEEDGEKNCDKKSETKKYRDECVSVTEELVDGHYNGLGSSLSKDVAEIAKAWTFARKKEQGKEELKAGIPLLKSAVPTASQYLESDLKDRGGFLRRTFGSNQRKRKLSAVQYSPPSKHLRSSRWSRGKMLPSSSVCKRWRQLAASLVTNSRLRSRRAK